jgi:transposase
MAGSGRARTFASIRHGHLGQIAQANNLQKQNVHAMFMNRIERSASMTNFPAAIQVPTVPAATPSDPVAPSGSDPAGTDQPAADQPATDPTATDQTATDQTATDQPATDQPATDQPGADQPGADQPATDQPAAAPPADAAADPMGLHAPPAHRLPRRRYSPPRPWEPLSDDEWAVLAPFVLCAAGPGRPPRDLRARLDAVFWMAARPARALGPWRALPTGFGKPDTASRQFRRWAAAGLWSRLLRALADPDYPGIRILRRLESWICRTYRRAWRLFGVAGVALARRLGFLSALRAPSVFLPDPDLSEYVGRCLQPVFDRLDRAAPGAFRPPRAGFLKACAWLFGAAGGRRRIPRHMAPP